MTLMPWPERPVPSWTRLRTFYLTAEAIGEDALVRHFDEVSQRQHDLIREYYNSRPGLP